MDAALATIPDVLSWRVFDGGWKLEIKMTSEKAVARHEGEIHRLLNSLGWRLWATGHDGYVLKRMMRPNPSRSYDHEKLLLAVRNHPGCPAGIDAMSYEGLYAVAQRLRIRS